MPHLPSLVISLGVVSAPLWLVKVEPYSDLCSRSPCIRPLSEAAPQQGRVAGDGGGETSTKA